MKELQHSEHALFQSDLGTGCYVKMCLRQGSIRISNGAELRKKRIGHGRRPAWEPAQMKEPPVELADACVDIKEKKLLHSCAKPF